MLETATPNEHDQIQATLADLPEPQHIYTLCLSKQEQQQEINIWQLSYRLCRNEAATDTPITIDPSLLDSEMGDVDWIALDQKAKQLVEKAFQSLG